MGMDIGQDYFSIWEDPLGRSLTLTITLTLTLTLALALTLTLTLSLTLILTLHTLGRTARQEGAHRESGAAVSFFFFFFFLSSVIFPWETNGAGVFSY
jgi:hypothetical protein